MNSNTPSPTPGDIIAQYRAKIHRKFAKVARMNMGGRDEH